MSLDAIFSQSNAIKFNTYKIRNIGGTILFIQLIPALEAQKVAIGVDRVLKVDNDPGCVGIFMSCDAIHAHTPIVMTFGSGEKQTQEENGKKGHHIGFKSGSLKWQWFT